MKLIVILIAGIVLIVALLLRIKEDIERKLEAKEEARNKSPTHLKWVDELINNTLKIKQ